jgi:hypothetical protein
MAHHTFQNQVIGRGAQSRCLARTVYSSNPIPDRAIARAFPQRAAGCNARVVPRTLFPRSGSRNRFGVVVMGVGARGQSDDAHTGDSPLAFFLSYDGLSVLLSVHR